ncbi:uncharacterized protein [Glycine max]|uniref:uncharacterized protein n=1 Tax=Glycine max TaxID=3847 RepID=UPI001B355166|nr:uncharacterized protein LOC102659618 [Glycine max]
MHGASADGAFDRDELRGMSPLRLATKDCISQLLLTRPKVHGSASLTSDFSTCTWVCRVAGIGCSTCSCSGRSWKAPLEQLQWDLKTQVQRDQVALPCKICVLKVKKKVVACVERGSWWCCLVCVLPFSKSFKLYLLLGEQFLLVEECR